MARRFEDQSCTHLPRAESHLPHAALSILVSILFARELMQAWHAMTAGCYSCYSDLGVERGSGGVGDNGLVCVSDCREGAGGMG